MIRDGTSLSGGEELVADVCIIGGGPAGLTVATELLGSGLRVLVVESGGRTGPPGGESYGSSKSVGIRYPLETSRARGLGGSANRWDIETPAGGPRVRLRELEETDFEDRPGVRTPGWPFPRSVLEPYYRRARDLFRLQPAAGGDAPLGDGVEERLFSFGPARTFTQALPARLEAERETTVLCDAVITELHATASGAHVESLSGRSRGGTRFTVRASTYVLACGGIENARVLLASRATTPAGLGNAQDQVGRYFTEHPHITSGVAVPRSDLARRSEAWDLFLRQGHPVQRKYALTADVQRREGLLDIAYFLVPRPAAAVLPLSRSGRRDARSLSAVRHAYRVLRDRQWTPGQSKDVGVLALAALRMASYSARQRAALGAAQIGRAHLLPVVFTLGGMAEQTPRADSAVRLGSGVDEFGMPQAELDWHVSTGDADSLRRCQELITPALSRVLDVRVTSLLEPGELPGLGVGYHHMGTTRMSVRPERGVVDPDCRVYGVRNLFIAGSSVFPTGGSANPTLTVVALAARLADLLRREGGPPTVST